MMCLCFVVESERIVLNEPRIRMPKKSIYDNPHIYKKYMHIILEFLPTPNT